MPSYQKGLASFYDPGLGQGKMFLKKLMHEGLAEIGPHDKNKDQAALPGAPPFTRSERFLSLTFPGSCHPDD